jgi:hypothetical protein
MSMEEEQMKLSVKHTGAFIALKTSKKWYVRVWWLISNPFVYVFKGEMRW